MSTNAPSTNEPITTDGWYERTDGTVGYYVWSPLGTGRAPQCQVAVAGWAETTPSPEVIAALRTEASAHGDDRMVETCDAAREGYRWAELEVLAAIAHAKAQEDRS